MEMTKLSIVVATYNSSDTVQRCIDSVLMQNFKNWELLIVDDGSTDDTQKIVGEYLNNANIFYYFIEHKGVSAARNFGLNHAKGEYVVFCDSDDEYPENAFATMLDRFDKDADFIVFGTKIVNCNDKYPMKNIIPKDIKYTENLEHALYYEIGARPFVWNCCYKKEFLKKVSLSFNETINLGEDHIFQFKAFLSASCVKFVPDVCYVHYNCRPNSCMMYYKEHPVERIEKHFEIISLIYDFYQEKSIPVSDDYYKWVLRFVFPNFMVLCSQNRKKIQLKAKKAITHIKPTKNLPFKYKMKFLIIKSAILQSIYRFSKNIE